MPAWFTLDGNNCEDVGIHVLEYPDDVIAKRRMTSYTVPGGANAWVYDGAWGYEDVVRTIRCTVDEDADIDAVIRFLLPDTRNIVLGCRPQFMYTGVLQNAVEIQKILRASRKKKNFDADYLCNPFKRLAIPGEDITLTAAGGVDHPGTARCYPVITVAGSGTVKLTFHAVDDFTLYGLESGEPRVIDCGAMVCTDAGGYTDLSRLSAGDYPWLDPGYNSISWTGTVTSIVIRPNFLWL